MTKEIIGNHSSRVDRKNRAPLPAAFRKQFFNEEAGKEEKKFILWKAEPQIPEIQEFFGETAEHLIALVSETLEQIEKILYSGEESSKNKVSHLYMRASLVLLDSQNRIPFPSDFELEPKEELEFVGCKDFVAVFKNSALEIVQQSEKSD
ncbi:hypothetical protein K9M59_01025 [Candidatus Gracilibacteria bacterium]|nr:hypothetical protein [Candidatus Gracilibacteria bacterium]MCF7819154.1 hypothetical protein [Candidatus Gracilibacteria bacterium]